MSPLRVMVATPTYDGRVDARYMSSLLDTIAAAPRDKVDIGVKYVLGDANLGHARDVLLGMALDENVDVLFWIDADQVWTPEAFDRVLQGAWQRGWCGGLTPMKGLRNRYAGQPLADGGQPDADGLVEMRFVGCGFTAMRRDVCLALWKNSATYASQGMLEHSVYAFAIEDGKYVGEDVRPCKVWRSLGGSIWCDPRALVDHVAYITVLDAHDAAGFATKGDAKS